MSEFKPPRQRLDIAERRFFETIQVILAKSNAEKRVGERFRVICGVDAAYSNDDVIAVASSFDSSNGRLLENSEYRGKVTFPYVPGLFFLREGPFVCEAVSKLSAKPNLVCFDSHGTAHPRHSGLATICGVVLGMPSVGVAKSKLVGEIRPYKNKVDELVDSEGDRIGLITKYPKRFWSCGYLLPLHELERLIDNFAGICLESINKSHTRATEILRKYY